MKEDALFHHRGEAYVVKTRFPNQETIAVCERAEDLYSIEVALEKTRERGLLRNCFLFDGEIFSLMAHPELKDAALRLEAPHNRATLVKRSSSVDELKQACLAMIVSEVLES